MPKPKRTRFKKKKWKRNSGTLPGRPSTGRPPGVPWVAKKNPSGDLEGMAILVGAGAAGFGGTKLVTRITYAVAAKKSPRWAKHLAALSSLVTLGVLWGVAHRIKKVAEYHTPMVVGSAIASLQTLAQTYMPKYAWLVGHPSEDPAMPQQVATGSDGIDYETLLEGGGTYDPRMDAGPKVQGRMRQTRKGPTQTAAQQAQAAVNDDAGLDELLHEIADENEDLAQGVFQN